MIGLIILLVYDSRLLSDSLGFGLARRRSKPRAKHRTLQIILWLAAWAIAIEALYFRCGGIFCRTTQQASSSSSSITNAVSGNQGSLALPLLQTAYQFSNLVQTNWFYAAFYGLVIVSSVIFARAYIISWQETRAKLEDQKIAARAEAVTAVEDAIHILMDQPGLDPRTRIINSYQRMVQAAQRIGATITSDQTARELEATIHLMLGIKGKSMRELTNLFEEARYSLHQIGELDAEKAQQCLLNIADEMNIAIAI